ncbi:MAG: hypothetical protein DMF69_10010 [Acidobacteria bacterium]|nr:MAG: hypothetical protein DMF69_10010 [Acidobacteriota bacterium]
MLAALAKPVGRTSVALDGRSAENRTQETNLGNLVADSFRRVAVSDVALVNGGSIRVDEIIRPGRLTERDVLSVLPFKNKLIKIEVTGALLREALEHGVSRVANNAEPGGFPQVSGIQFSYDASRRPGDRIVDLKVKGEPESIRWQLLRSLLSMAVTVTLCSKERQYLRRPKKCRLILTRCGVLLSVDRLRQRLKVA